MSSIVIGMSGGVDSAVAALLLKRAGHHVTGLFMKNWEDDDDGEYCSTREDLVDAAAAADVIGIDFEAVNFAAEYKDRVFADFLREYGAGRTPNPDVLCNAEIKFKAFLDHAVKLGAEKIATGHYAGVREVRASAASGAGETGGTDGTDGTVGTGESGAASSFQLLRAADASKDQSYFLHRLNQAQLSRVLFPLAEINKTEVRRIAALAGLGNHAKKDSTGICFIGERPFREFLNRYLPKQPGAMLDENGKTIGEHIGLMFYTIGQRKGIGVGGKKTGSGEPWFVAQKDVAANTITVVQGHAHPLLQARGLHAADASWVAGHPPAAHSYGAKTRYRQTDAVAYFGAGGEGSLNFSNPGDTTGAVAGSSSDANEFVLRFDAPQWAVTPGQSAVVYDGDVCLGGGIIAAAAA